MILIGSRALQLRRANLLDREPKDFDFVAWQEEIPEGLEVQAGKHIDMGPPIVEYDPISFGSSNELLADLVAHDGDVTTVGTLPTLDMLYTIKMAHRFRKNSPHFWKTAVDIHRLRAAGATVRPEYREFMKLREKETYTYAHPSLNRTKKEFFNDDGVNYVYDHDSIHRAIALQERPAYTYFAKDGEEVLSDRAKFEAAPFEIKLNSVIEESCVLAVERSLVPFPGQWNPKQAFVFALSKVCSSITSGWWRAWAYDHIFQALKAFPADYFERFQAGLMNGVVTEAK